MDCPVIEDILHEEDRFALMIDGANLHPGGACARFRHRLPSPARHLLAGSGRLVRACYYTALLEDQEYSSIRPLVDWLEYNGYTVVTKPTKEFTDASGRRKSRATWILSLRSTHGDGAQLDHLVLFSGDGDFRRLIEALQRGARVTVVSTIARSRR